jgi:hypothetical protein
MLLGNSQRPAPVTLLAPRSFDHARADAVFDEVVELALASDDFRFRLQRKLEQLAETTPRGRRPTPRWRVEIVKNTVAMVQTHYRSDRRPGWKKKAGIVEAIAEAARILGISKTQARDRFYNR